MVEKIVDEKDGACGNQKTPLEVDKRIHTYFSYWHKWELTGIQIDRPEIYRLRTVGMTEKYVRAYCLGVRPALSGLLIG